ncbi:MAG: pilus assembly PilX N-terminal domain-containing protein [Candidatus Krumholzibacteriota bacterium]
MSQTEMKTTAGAPDREGFAMVTTLLIVLVISVLAVGVAWIAGSEKKTTFAESVHVQSIYSADAGGEAAINFLRMSDIPPLRIDTGTGLVRSQAVTNLQGSQTFDYRAFFVIRRARPGWGEDYLDYDYRIASHGNASRLGESGVELVVSRLYKEGY